jgi:hypothetical protein
MYGFYFHATCMICGMVLSPRDNVTTFYTLQPVGERRKQNGGKKEILVMHEHSVV